MLKKIIIIVVIFVASLFYWRSLNWPADRSANERLFLVSQGETINQAALSLRKEDLIKSSFYFKYIMWRRRLNVKAGQYLISPRLTTEDIIKILALGEVLNQEKQIRIIEGWNIGDINNYLNKNKVVAENSFINIAKKEIKSLKLGIALDEELRRGTPKGATLEGFLFPDTYRIGKEAAAEDIIIKMLYNFDKKLTPEMKQEIGRQKKTVFEIVTMASIIEKEVRTADDMKIISGVFWDRIKNRQALESCATLAYILGVNKKQYSLEDTKIDSLYNTYKHRGLPPGPIANPGLNAIMAAIYPIDTEYNYFLSDPETGKTVYSRTLEEHNRNKAKYLK